MMLTVHVKPGSKKESVEWIDADTIKASVRAVAEKGKANEALIELLSKTFRVKKAEIEIIRGRTTRLKHVLIPELHPPLHATKGYSE